MEQIESCLGDFKPRMLQNNLDPEVAEHPQALVVYGGIGRAARNAEGTVIMYADTVTRSMRLAIDETERRRAKQIAHNREKGIEPRAIVKQVKDLIDGVYSEKAGRDAQRLENEALQRARVQELSEKDLAKEIKRLEKQMLEHARNLEFEQAAQARDALSLLKARVFGADAHDA